MMMMCISNLNVIGFQFTKDLFLSQPNSRRNTAISNLVEMSSREDVDGFNDPSLDKIQDDLENSECYKSVQEARKIEREANTTAKTANDTYHDALTNLDESDVDFEIISLRQIKRIVLKIMTGTHAPTQAPTNPPTQAPTNSPTSLANPTETPPPIGTTTQTGTLAPPPTPSSP